MRSWQLRHTNIMLWNVEISSSDELRKKILSLLLKNLLEAIDFKSR